jgi:uncharacterized protein YndB with AHSA1/START domain
MQSKTMTADRTRSHEERVALDASPEVVWRAIADAEELVRWFDAKVTPGEGGSISLSWGEFWSGTSAIEVWQPNRRLRTVERRQDSTGRVVEIAVDYIIEGHGGQTVLRVVHSDSATAPSGMRSSTRSGEAGSPSSEGYGTT